jgi:hypothetical protein
MPDPQDVSEPQDRAEVLDEDKLGGAYPPDRRQAVEDPRVTAQGEWLPESLEDRVRREHPEHPVGAGEAPDQDPEQDAVTTEDPVVDVASEPTPTAAEEAAVRTRSDPDRAGIPADPETR